MTQQETISFEQIQSPASGYSKMPGEGMSIAEIVQLLLRRKRIIAGFTFALATITTVVMFSLPPSYKAEATILPQQQQQSSLSALASGALGGLAGAGMASPFGLKTAADMYIGFLKSRTIADNIVDKFQLERVYGKHVRSETREALKGHAIFENGKDSLITITVRDRDPHRAADMANAFIDELYKQNSRLAITDASQRRLFFEQQLNQEKEALANAEIALKNTQQTTGLLTPNGQAEALIRSGAQLRADIASHEVQLQAMRAYATEDNPQLQIVKRELSGLQGQLAQVENNPFNSKLQLSATKMPEANLQYIRKFRDLKYHETLYELIAKQYEASRMDEAKQAPVIQVVDRAIVPDRDSRQRKTPILISMIVGFLLAAGTVLVLHNTNRHSLNA